MLKIKKRIIFIIIFLLSVITLLFNFKVRSFSKNYFLLDTYISVTFFKIKQNKANKLFFGVEKILKEYNLKLSSYNKDSFIFKLNNSLLKKDLDNYTELDKEIYDLILSAKNLSEQAEGAFDISVFPLVKLWDITNNFNQENKIPTEKEIKDTLNLINYKNIILKKEDNKYYIKLNQGISLDLGAISKGYIGQKIKNYLLENKLKSAMINLGGNVVLLGKKEIKNNQIDFKIGVDNPFIFKNEDLNASIIGYLKANDISAVTSGINQRFFKKDDIIYHHILDLKTGYPVNNNLQSVSIINKDSFLADALSTIVFVKGLKKGIEYINKYHKDAGYIIITKDKKIIVSSNIDFILEDKDLILRSL